MVNIFQENQFFQSSIWMYRFYFVSGSYLTIVERVSDKIIEINGSYPDDYEFENNTFFTETIVQTDLGMLSRKRFMGYI